MGKFRQISTELCPLNYLSIFFALFFCISLPIFFKLCMSVDIGKECLGIADLWIYFVKQLQSYSPSLMFKLRFA